MYLYYLMREQMIFASIKFKIHVKKDLLSKNDDVVCAKEELYTAARLQ